MTSRYRRRTPTSSRRRRSTRTETTVVTPIIATPNRKWGSILTSIALSLLGLYFLWTVRDVLPPFMMALLIAIIVDPLIQRLEKNGWPRRRSVPLIFLFLLLLLVALLTWGFPVLLDQIVGLTSNFSDYLERAQSQADRLLHLPAIRRMPDSVRQPMLQQINRSVEHVPQILARVPEFMATMLSRVFWFLIALLATFYLLLDLPEINRSFLRWVPFRYRKHVHDVGTEVAAVFASYIRGLFIVCLLNGVTVAIILTVMEIPNALAIGALTGALYMVPYVGTVANVTLSGLITFFAYNMTKALVVVAVMLVIHQIFDYIITPRILGKHVGLHPLASLFAMITAGSLFGIPGIILAVPIAASIVVVMRHLYPRIMGRPSGEIKQA